MSTAWPSCATGGPARTASTWPSSGCPRGSARPSPRRIPWRRPCSRCGRSSSGTHPTTPGCGVWCPRRSPREVVESLRTRTQEVVDELLDAAMEADRVDLLEEFAYPLPVRIICDLLGVPLEDQDRFKVWSSALARGLDPDFLLLSKRSSPPAPRECSSSPSTSSSSWPSDGRNPGDDLLSRLVAGGGRGHRAERGRDAVDLHPVAGGRARDHGQSDRGRGAGPAAPPRPAGAVPDRPRAHPERRGGDAPLRVPGAAHRPGTHRGLPRSAACEFEAGDFAMLLLASANRDPGAVRGSRSGSTSPGTRTTTSGSGSGSTTASAHRWPAWRPRWP